MAFNLVNVVLNASFACIIAVFLTNIIFSIIARLLNYDFIFAIETGRILFNLDEEFYSNTYAGLRGFFLHCAVFLFIAYFYVLVFLPLLSILPKMGPYIYETPGGTAVFQNLFWLGLLGLIFYLIWLIRDKNYDKFALMLFVYYGSIILIMGIIFGLYLFGVPGILSF